MNPASIAPAIADGMKTSCGALATTTPQRREHQRRNELAFAAIKCLSNTRSVTHTNIK